MPEYIELHDRVAFLSNIPLFATMGPDQLKNIAERTETLEYPPDTYICREGEWGDSLYVIMSGAVSLVKDGIELGTFRRQGDCVGEMTLIDGQPRSASLRTTTDVRLLQLKSASFESLLAAYPESCREIMKVLSERLREGLNVQIEAIRNEAAREQELILAEEIQHGLLPDEEICLGSIRTVGYCKSANTVGGDYYDYLRVSPDQLGIVIVDVMGHGFHSALFAAMIKSCLQNQVRHAGSVPSVIRATEQTVEQAKSRIYLSMCYVLINTASHTMTFTNAGHPHPFHYRHNTGYLETLPATCIPLGLMPGMPLPGRYFRRLSWDPGDILLLYSDGITETRNQQKELFSEDRLRHLFLKHVDRPIEEIRTIILDAVEEFADGKPPQDDITLVVVRL